MWGDPNVIVHIVIRTKAEIPSAFANTGRDFSTRFSRLRINQFLHHILNLLILQFIMFSFSKLEIFDLIDLHRLTPLNIQQFAKRTSNRCIYIEFRRNHYIDVVVFENDFLALENSFYAEEL